MTDQKDWWYLNGKGVARLLHSAGRDVNRHSISGRQPSTTEKPKKHTSFVEGTPLQEFIPRKHSKNAKIMCILFTWHRNHTWGGNQMQVTGTTHFHHVPHLHPVSANSHHMHTPSEAQSLEMNMGTYILKTKPTNQNKHQLENYLSKTHKHTKKTLLIKNSSITKKLYLTETTRSMGKA